MQEKIIEHFISLTKIPHCSGESKALLDFLVAFAGQYDYMVEVDDAQNILIWRGTPTLALQAHYDMVCMGRAPHIETTIEAGWMSARESSLGADNGMAIAMMMVLMEQKRELEFLLTADEEIGLIGANAIDLKLQSPYMLNLDYEDEAIVCIGCAGGADLVAKRSLSQADEYGYNYEVRVEGLAGGHSGVDIDKGIPNAIKVLAEYLADKEVRIASAQGGERRNSIPSSVVMQLSSREPLEETDLVKLKPLDRPLVVYESDDFLELLVAFRDGVHLFNDEFNLPDTSINLALVTFEEGEVKIECSSRAMNEEGLEMINQESIKLFSYYHFDCTAEYKYPAWRPEVNAFTEIVNQAMLKEFGQSRYEAIHAGLECGVLLEHYPQMKFASIGPTIRYPHSTREDVNLDSVEKTFNVVEEIIATL